MHKNKYTTWTIRSFFEERLVIPPVPWFRIQSSFRNPNCNITSPNIGDAIKSLGRSSTFHVQRSKSRGFKVSAGYKILLSITGLMCPEARARSKNHWFPDWSRFRLLLLWNKGSTPLAMSSLWTVAWFLRRDGRRLGFSGLVNTCVYFLLTSNLNTVSGTLNLSMRVKKN